MGELVEYVEHWDTKMAMLSFCGVDVSKDRLDVVVLPAWSIIRSICPATRSCIAGPAPR
jgi:hypothetical protein